MTFQSILPKYSSWWPEEPGDSCLVGGLLLLTGVFSHFLLLCPSFYSFAYMFMEDGWWWWWWWGHMIIVFFGLKVWRQRGVSMMSKVTTFTTSLQQQQGDALHTSGILSWFWFLDFCFSLFCAQQSFCQTSLSIAATASQLQLARSN